LIVGRLLELREIGGLGGASSKCEFPRAIFGDKISALKIAKFLQIIADVLERMGSEPGRARISVLARGIATRACSPEPQVAVAYGEQIQ
jgi:hypothetical protein